jgi:hypothetical protein
MCNGFYRGTIECFWSAAAALSHSFWLDSKKGFLIERREWQLLSIGGASKEIGWERRAAAMNGSESILAGLPDGIF